MDVIQEHRFESRGIQKMKLKQFFPTLCVVFIVFLLSSCNAGGDSAPSSAGNPAEGIQVEGETVDINSGKYGLDEVEEIFCEGFDYCSTDAQKWHIYDSSELSDKIIESRKDSGELIIERSIGIVTDIKKDKASGIVINAFNPKYNYIGYSAVVNAKDLHRGTMLVTYLVYNPKTNYIDDIVERYDYVINRDFEVR